MIKREINEHSLKLREKNIAKILKKNENERSHSDNVELAYYKRDSGQKITYDEFVLMLTTNDELLFEYGNATYEVIHSKPNIITFYVTEYENGKLKFERSEDYSSANELLINARIENKAIKDIWEFVTVP